MSPSARTILVTGANGFIGRRLVARLAGDPHFAEARITACDIVEPALSPPRVERVAGDLTDPRFLARIVEHAPDLVFHLASILGGAAEAHYDLARAYNANHQPEQSKEELILSLEIAPGFKPAQKLLLQLSK